MITQIKAYARERRVRQRKPTTNLLEVLSKLSYAYRTEVRTIINNFYDIPSYMRGKEFSNGK